ncbi:MAG TPA: Ig-like domain-containing protein, partial [Anaerolineae bacterium]|nr:Ig-like domain-containing protein [Anaerolineae bacterium]
VTAYAKDAAGNTSPTSLAVGTIKDTTPPEVIGIDPADGATGVAKDTMITITFSENVQVGTAYDSITVKADTKEIDINKAISGNTLVLDLVKVLHIKTIYTVDVPAGAVQDAVGGALATGYSFNFTTSEVSARGKSR